MINRGGIGDLLLARKMANEPTVQDVQHYAHGGEAETIKMPQSLKELQDWKNPRSDKDLMEHFFTDRQTGIEGGNAVAMPANVDELLAYMKAKRKGYADGGETDSDAPDAATRDSIYGGRDNTPSFREAEDRSMREYNRAVEQGWSPVDRSNDGGRGRDSSTFSGPVSRFGTDVTLSNINAAAPSTVSPMGNFDIYGGLGGGSSLITPAPAPSFRSEAFSSPFSTPYVSPTMTAARMEQNPVSSDFNYKAMESLNPWFQTKAAGFLNKMMDEGLTPYFSSGSRTVAQQAGIYANPSPYGAAPPGMSAHNFGQAFDIGGLTNKQMIDAGVMAEASGLGWGGRFRTYDPVHFQEMPSSVSPAQYAASVGVPMYKGTSVGGTQTAAGARPEPFDVGKAVTDRAAEVFSPGGIGSLVLGAALPPVALYDMTANVLNFAGAGLPTTASMINKNLGVSAPETPQAPALPPQVAQPQRPVTETPDSSTTGGPTTRGVYDIYANADYTYGGPTTRGTSPAAMQVADATGSIVPTGTQAAPVDEVAPKEQGWWDKLFNSPENVQRVLNSENTYNPGYPNTTSGLTKEEYADVISQQTGQQIDPSQVRARISTMNGVQQVDWYTKGLDEALAEIVTGPFKAIGSVFGFGKDQASTQQPATYIPSGGIGDHQTAVAQNMLNRPTEDTTPPKKKAVYEIWPSTEKDYSGPYEKFIV